MAVLPVLRFPDPFLRKKARPVTRFDAALSKLADAMLATMYEEGGIGLAAPQVGQSKQLVVVDLNAGEEEVVPREPQVFVNPLILSLEGEMITEEGCLSVPEFTAEVARAERIRLRYQSLQGEEREVDLDGLAAVCLQHEIDHLLGKLFVDYLPPLKREMVKKRLMKLAQPA